MVGGKARRLFSWPAPLVLDAPTFEQRRAAGVDERCGGARAFLERPRGSQANLARTIARMIVHKGTYSDTTLPVVMGYSLHDYY